MGNGYRHLGEWIKWGFITVGVVSLLLMLWGKIWPHRNTDTAMISSGREGCQFTFQVEQGEWMGDRFAGTTSMVLKDTTSRPKTFLTGWVFWSYPDEKGGFNTVIERKCRIQKKPDIITKEGHVAKFFFADQCATGGNWYADHARANFLYGYVRQGENSHFMWISSDDKSAVMKRESEFKRILKSYSTTFPDCVANRKPAS